MLHNTANKENVRYPGDLSAECLADTGTAVQRSYVENTRHTRRHCSHGEKTCLHKAYIHGNTWPVFASVTLFIQ